MKHMVSGIFICEHTLAQSSNMIPNNCQFYNLGIFLDLQQLDKAPAQSKKAR